MDFGVQLDRGEDEDATAVGVVCVYVNHFTAKRFNGALQMSVERHTSTFGDLNESYFPLVSVPQEVATCPVYANFVRVTGTPEELIVDFGLNNQPMGRPKDDLAVSCQIVMDFLTANYLRTETADIIARYESRHGTLETDVQKRAKADG